MDFKPVKPISTQCNTNTNRQPETSSQQAKQTFYIPSFKEFLQDLLMEQQEQM